MPKPVTYDKAMRERALADRKGLCTIDILYPSKRQGKFGTRITTQGPIGEEEAKAVGDFLVKYWELRNAAQLKPERPTP